MKKNMTDAVVISLILLVIACYEIPLRQFEPTEVPQILIAPPLGVSANGVDTLRIKLYFPIRPILDCTNINFKTTEGVFFENNKAEYSTTEFYRTSGDSIVMQAKVKSTLNPGMYFVTADLPKNFRITKAISFLPSYPKTIVTDENKFAVKGSLTEEIQLIANAKALRGLPSKGTVIEFLVDGKFSSSNSKWFRSLTSTNSDGQASVFFSPAAFGTYRGTVKYKAIFRNPGGTEVVGDGEFEIID